MVGSIPDSVSIKERLTVYQQYFVRLVAQLLSGDSRWASFGRLARVAAFVVAAFAGVSLFGRAPVDAKESRPPNFVVVFTDDQGYQDVGVFGSPDIETPNLDRMAAEGAKFTDFYVSQAVCSAR